MADWRIATLIKSEMVAVDVKSLTFALDLWIDHQAGQHYDIRLTASNGYQAERSYSLASPPEQRGTIEFGIQLLLSGEVSSYLFELQPGQQVEVRGPIGGHFVWDVSLSGPLVLIGGGSGMVPLMSILRHHFQNIEKDRRRRIIFLISARTLNHVLYREELTRLQEQDPELSVVLTITDDPPPGWTGYRRRVDRGMIEKVFSEVKEKKPLIYICGPTPFVETVANEMVATGFDSRNIKTERFGGN